MNTPTGRERTDRLRAIPLSDILRTVGARADPHDPAKWHTARGTLSVNGSKFFNWNESGGGGGAIDLALHLNRMSFTDALNWLARLPLASLTGSLRQVQPNHSAQTPHPRPLAVPTPVAAALPVVLRYLNIQRRLPLDLLHPLIDSGDLYADHHANAVFILRNRHNMAVGAELRGTGPRPWRGMAPGSRKQDGYFAIAPPRADLLVLCESAIDAISCRALHPLAICVSTSGARADPAWLPALLARNLTTYCGFDADATGRRMAQSMILRHPTIQRLCPPAHDWNLALRPQA
jgi:hypothetical protein